MSWKNSLFSIFQVLGLLVKTLAADEKSPVLTRDNLTIPIEMQFSRKQKIFSHFFAAFLKSRIKLKYLKKKDDPHRFCISETTASENVVR